MSYLRVLVAGITLLALMCAGCSAKTSAGSGSIISAKPASEPAASRPPAPCGPAGTFRPAPSVSRSTAALWPEKLVEREGPTTMGQTVDPTAGVAYALISRTIRLLRGPYVLECTDLRAGTVHRGPVFPVGSLFAVDSLTVASGYLWVSRVSGSGSQPVVSQLDQRSLALLRSIRLPAVPAFYPQIAMAAGPGDSVWIGSFQTLLRVDAATGAVLARVMLPPHLAVSDISADPARRHLYVSAAHVVKGGVEGNVVVEYGARSGHRLAVAASGLITDSVVGAQLTAVPGGVWASFRTGMLGLTIHLRRRDLAMIAPPGPGIALTPANRIFHWPMGATTVYGGGALWVANQAGIVACLDPRTGQIRAMERVPQSRLISPLAVDPVSRQLFALAGHGLARVVPPRRCWS
jgi:hypothetical protein